MAIYQKRWQTEVIFKELKSGLGLGQMQVTKDSGRVERFVALGMMAYLCLLRLEMKANPNATSWSIFQAKWSLLGRIVDERESHLRKKGGCESDYDYSAA